MKRQTTTILLLLLSGTLALAAASHSHWERVPARDHARANPFAGNPAAAVAGERVYNDHCAQCHKAGARGDGGKHPSLRSEQLRAVTDGDLEWFLRQGDLAHGMPSWSSLPQAQRWQLVTYLRSIQ
ncbi:MAG: c-type cytochrome [Acidobacteriota bacterium]|nr:c-type cytochrome [Acidobacteriota bacterium]